MTHEGRSAIEEPQSGPALSIALSGEVLNALSAHIAVLDSRGVIVAVNDAWTRFGLANGARDARSFVGADYLAVCERALEAGTDPVLSDTVEGLRGLLGGTRTELSIEYPCDSPTERRWFLLTATSVSGVSGARVVIAHADITERKRMEHALRDTERTLRSVLEALPVGVWFMDRTGRIVGSNPESRRIWGGARYVGLEDFGEYKGWWRSTGHRITAGEWAAARAIRNGETSIDEEIEIECFDGTRKVILNSAIPLRHDGGDIEGAIIVNQDITARKRDEDDLRRAKDQVEATSRELAHALDRERILARVDGLTGATNRRHFYELASHEISVALRYHQPLSLVLFDVDEFKRVNDTLGHHAGDELLRRVAEISRRYLRQADIFARYGGDEFVVVLPHTEPEGAAVVADRIRNDVAAQSVATAAGAAQTTISCGVAGLRSRNDRLEALIRRADLALYAAKDDGRNRTSLYRPELSLPGSD